MYNILEDEGFWIYLIIQHGGSLKVNITHVILFNMLPLIEIICVLRCFKVSILKYWP